AFSFRGRISRSTFWLAFFCLLVAQIVFLFTLRAVSDSLDLAGIALVFIVWYPLIAWVSLAVQVKRWHDLGVTGWAVLINLVPVINILVILIALGMMPGKPDANEYGANPLSVPK